MGCGNEISEWDDNAVKDSMAGKNTGLDPTILKETMPAVREAIDQRCMELMQEKTDDARKNLQEKIAQSGREPTLLEKLDLEVEPTQREYKMKFGVAEELGLKKWQVVNDPTVFGTKGVKNISEKMKEVMYILHNSKMNPEMWDVTNVDGIMFVDANVAEKNELFSKNEKTAGYVLGPATRIENKNLSRNVHIVLDEKGELLSKVDEGICIQPGKSLEWTIAHEILHINSCFEGSLVDDVVINNLDQWENARVAQLREGAISEYSHKDEGEFMCEHFAAWVTDDPFLCPEMNKFFDDHFSR